MDSIIAYSPALMKNGDNLTITMPKVSEYHRSGKTWYSPPFYYKEGYKMCLVVSGMKMESGRCTGLTIGIKVLQGENNDKLKWPISHPLCRRPPPPPFVNQIHICVCGLQQLEIRNGYKSNSPMLVNDCLTFNMCIRYSDCYLYV